MILGQNFWNFVWIWQLADADCVISIEYYSELLNHVPKNWEVLARPKYIDNFVVSICL